MEKEFKFKINQKVKTPINQEFIIVQRAFWERLDGSYDERYHCIYVDDIARSKIAYRNFAVEDLIAMDLKEVPVASAREIELKQLVDIYNNLPRQEDFDGTTVLTGCLSDGVPVEFGFVIDAKNGKWKPKEDLIIKA